LQTFTDDLSRIPVIQQSFSMNLKLLKRDGIFRMETNVLGHTIGEVLSQEQEGKWKPIAFLLRTMQLAERNYKIYNKKLFAIVEALT